MPAVAEADHRGAAVRLRQLAQPGQRIGEVGFARPDFLQARLRAPLGAVVVARKRPRDRAPEQIGRRGDVAVRSEFVRDRA